MSDFIAKFEVFSPRWGHPDTYNIIFKPDQMCITQGMFEANCKQDDNADPVWDGYGCGDENPLMAIFSNDSIFAPEIVPFLLERAWCKWKEGALEEAVLREGLNDLFKWIDQTGRSKPNSELWEGIF